MVPFKYTQEESSHNTVNFVGGIYPGALFSPIQIEVKKSVITFMSLFVFVLVVLFKFSSTLERHEISNQVCTDIYVIQNSKHSS
jgi:hypothetical protein